MTQEEAFAEIKCERVRQNALFGEPDGTGLSEFLLGNTIGTYVGKMHAALSEGDSEKFARRLIQIAALAVQCLESMRPDLSEELLAIAPLIVGGQ